MIATSNLLCCCVLVTGSFRPGRMRRSGSREGATLPPDSYSVHCVLLLFLLSFDAEECVTANSIPAWGKHADNRGLCSGDT